MLCRVASSRLSAPHGLAAERGALCIAALFGAGCLDLTPPWDQVGAERDGSAAGRTWSAGGGGGSDPGTTWASSTGGAGSGGATNVARADASPASGGSGGHVALQDAHGSDTPADATSGTGGTARADASVGSGGGLGSGGRTSTSGAGGAGDASTMAVPDSTAPGTGGAVGTGGRLGTGGLAGTGGLLGYGGYAPYDCANPVVPAAANVSGLVTDFTDWDATTGVWGTRDGLYGKIYEYSGTNGTMNKATVQGSPLGLHLTGTVGWSGYSGGGLTFLVVATLASFTQVQFDIYGGAPGCSLELQLQTFAQRPTTDVPAGGCNQAGGATCYTFPTMKQIVDVSSKLTVVKTVTAPLASFTHWSTASAVQVVGLQWQFTGTNVHVGSTCPIDVTITNIRFVP